MELHVCTLFFFKIKNGIPYYSFFKFSKSGINRNQLIILFINSFSKITITHFSIKSHPSPPPTRTHAFPSFLPPLPPSPTRFPCRRRRRRPPREGRSPAPSPRCAPSLALNLPPPPPWSDRRPGSLSCFLLRGLRFGFLRWYFPPVLLVFRCGGGDGRIDGGGGGRCAVRGGDLGGAGPIQAWVPSPPVRGFRVGGGGIGARFDAELAALAWIAR